MTPMTTPVSTTDLTITSIKSSRYLLILVILRAKSEFFDAIRIFCVILI